MVDIFLDQLIMWVEKCSFVVLLNAIQCTINLAISDGLASYFAHLGTISKNNNCNDENRLLGRQMKPQI